MQLSPHLHLELDKLLLKNSLDDSEISLSFAEGQLLSCLCQHQGQVVTKAQLLQAGWPDRVVGDSSLQNALSTLRRKLADFPDIELQTVPRRGYVIHLPSCNELETAAPKRFKPLPLLASCSVVIAIGLMALLWFNQPKPRPLFIQQSFTSELNQAQGPVQILAKPDYMPQLTQEVVRQRMAQQFVAESFKAPFASYRGMGKLGSQGDSFTFCPNYQDGQCPGDSLISIFGPTGHAGQQQLSTFLSTKIRMEEKTYNALAFEELSSADTSGMVEQLYFGDLYFKLDQGNLARADIRISAVPQGDNDGLFYFAACVTDEDCYTTPVKYRIHGRYVRTYERWDQLQVERYVVAINSLELSSPNRLSAMAKKIYSEFRQSELTRADLVFYKIYQDNRTAVWMLPFADQCLLWGQSRTLHL